VQTKSYFITLALIIFSIFETRIIAQDQATLNLETAVGLALQNNHLLNVKRLQVDEKQGKVVEDKIKYLPVVGIGGSYQYNTNLPSLTVAQGEFGEFPIAGVTIPFPFTDETIVMGEHNIYNAGVTLYQPLTQLGKIEAGVQVSRTELLIARTEESIATDQIKQAVEKLYFGLLINNKQIEEAQIKVRLAEIRLQEVETALSAGKTVESNIYGLAASAADEKQNLLKLQIQYEDLAADFKQLTGITTPEDLKLSPLAGEDLHIQTPAIDTSYAEASENNNDLRIAELKKTKAEYSVKASKMSYLPDIGLLGGYTYQKGTEIYPKNNAYVGASLKWNLQDLLTNRSIHQQRISLKGQAEENIINTKVQLVNNIGKMYRKISQSEELINVAAKVLKYRKEDLKIQTDRRNAGLNLESDLLEAEAALAKAESDYLSAQLNYRISASELNILIGNY
jgi:outer membrane protein